jgi:UDP-GlcNAc:undecaprenyl-phosphate GlcNAc-1-phosphate transferase
MLTFSTILLSVFITISLIPIMIRLASRYKLVDLPDPRKVHTSPVPRIGGLAMTIAIFLPLILWARADEFVKAYLLGAGILAVFGVVDDIKGLGYKAKFLGQILAALIIVFYGGVTISSLGSLLPGEMRLAEWASIALTLVSIVGVTNAINLADGLDGLAGGISLLSFCCIGYLAYLNGNSGVLLVSMAISGAIFGFLRFNTHPASLFMGDTGSQLLGFSAVVLAVKTTQADLSLSPVLPLIILGFPVLDTLNVMVQRISQGRSPFSPDKSHFHHRLISFGLSQSEAVFIIYIIQAVMVLSAIFFKYHADWLLLGGYIVFSIVTLALFAIADRKEMRYHGSALIEQVVKKRLRRIRDNNWTIRASFSVLKIILPLLFLFSCLLPVRIPAYVSLMSLGFGLLLLGVFFFKKQYLGGALRLVLYITIPFVLYLTAEGRAAWTTDAIMLTHHACFGLVALLVILTVRFSRRTKGFKMTTMDFLIIFIAVVVPNLTGPSFRSYNLGLLAVEMIVFFFSYEVLINELREKFDKVAIPTVAVSLLLAVRGYLG